MTVSATPATPAAVTPASPARLPETGAPTGSLVIAGLGAVLAGFGLTQLAGRRRRDA